MQRRILFIGLLGVASALTLGFLVPWWLYPSDQLPEGAYLRIMTAVNRDEPEAFFAYTETEAQHAAFTLYDYNQKSFDLVGRAYPEPERTQTLNRLKPLVDAGSGPEVFVHYVRKYGWMQRLRRDLSGVAHVEVSGERATVETVRGTRYPFRRRDNGIWGLTLFTARLVADAEKAARDYSVIQAAAQDFASVSAGRVDIGKVLKPGPAP